MIECQIYHRMGNHHLFVLSSLCISFKVAKYHKYVVCYYPKNEEINILNSIELVIVEPTGMAVYIGPKHFHAQLWAHEILHAFFLLLKKKSCRQNAWKDGKTGSIRYVTVIKRIVLCFWSQISCQGLHVGTWEWSLNGLTHHAHMSEEKFFGSFQ